MCVRGVLREVMGMGLSQELLAKKEKLCAEHYPKCITTECPLAKLFCYDIANFNDYYVNSHPALKRRITRILKAVE
jgi:hypothetical protein|nr:MAG TPA: hypothetical protein [Caudoviricetes sp.]